MAAYKTLDYLPDLTAAEMSSARTLTFKPPTATEITSWTSTAVFSSSEDNAILRSTFAWTGQEGATYFFHSSSYYDPFNIQVYDQFGNVVAIDTETGNTNTSDSLSGFVAPYSGTYYVNAGWNQGTTLYNKFVYVSIGENIDTIPSTTLMGTEGADILVDRSGKATITARGGNDLILPGSGNDVVDGGSGTDTVSYGAGRDNYTITSTAAARIVTAKAGTDGTDNLLGVERIKFADASLAFDTEGSAGKAYRLYQAVFGRAPDKDGLGSWINWFDQGNQLQSAATFFQTTPEFATKYGTTVSNDQFVRLLYENVLHRAPDTGGYLDWMGKLNLNQMTRSEVLVGFSESAENKAALIGVMQNGMEFTPVV